MNDAHHEAEVQHGAELAARSTEGKRSTKFNGKHRVQRIAKFNAAQERAKQTRKAQRKLKKQSQRRNRG